MSDFLEAVRRADEQACLRACQRADLKSELEARAFYRGWQAKAEFRYEQTHGNDQGGNSRLGAVSLLLVGSVIVLGYLSFLWTGLPMRPFAWAWLLVALPMLVFGVKLWRRAGRLDAERWHEFNDKWGKARADG